MLGDNNQGEFAGTTSERWTPHFWQALAICFEMTSVAVGGLLALIGLAKMSDD
ncbi:MAG: hypothetical protein WBA68_12300 [Alteraurantiacibacter sp.]